MVDDVAVAVRASEVHGRGLYATRDLDAGEQVCVAPAVVLDADESASLHDHLLASYLVAWDDTRSALPFGMVSFTNHAADPNAELIVDHEDVTVALVTRRRVPAGSELTIDYGPEHPV